MKSVRAKYKTLLNVLIMDLDDLVTDILNPEWGIGRIEKIEDEEITVWYDEVEKMVYYGKDSQHNLKLLD